MASVNMLYGTAWIAAKASKWNVFLGSFGSISSTAGSTAFLPQSRSELKSAVDVCLKQRPFPRVIAHRGGSKIGPENTKGALVNALKMDVDGTEFDLQLTSDRQLILLHDDTLERTAVPYSRAKDSLPETIDEVINFRIWLNMCILISPI